MRRIIIALALACVIAINVPMLLAKVSIHHGPTLPPAPWCPPQCEPWEPDWCYLIPWICGGGGG